MTAQKFAQFCAGSLEDLLCEGATNYSINDLIVTAHAIGMRDALRRPAKKKSGKSRW